MLKTIRALAMISAALLCGNASAYGLQAHETVAIDGLPPYTAEGEVLVGDFTGDGMDEVIALVRNEKFVMLTRTRDGYSQEVVYDCVANGLVLCVNARVGDFNNDGLDDIMLPGEGQFELLIANSDGRGFSRQSAPYSGRPFCGGYMLGDFNRDGNTDTMASCYDHLFNFHTDLFLGDGLGGFDEGRVVSDEGFGLSEAADWNGDGALDLIAFFGGRFKVFQNDGAGTFTVAQEYDIKPAGWGVAYQGMTVGDFNGDGRQDLSVVAHTFFRPDMGHLTGNPSELLIYRQGSSADIELAQTLEYAAQTPYQLLHEDLDNNGFADLVFADWGFHHLFYALNHGGEIAPVVVTGELGWGAPQTMSHQSFGDLNHDGCKDIAMFEVNVGVNIVHGMCESAPAGQSTKLALGIDHNREPGFVLGLHNKDRRQLNFSGILEIVLTPADATVMPSQEPTGCSRTTPRPGTWKYECLVTALKAGQAQYFGFAFSGGTGREKERVRVSAKVTGTPISRKKYPKIDRVVPVRLSSKPGG